MSGRKVFGGFHHFQGAGEEQKPESGEKRGLDPLMKVSAKEKVSEMSAPETREVE
jgi:hypothetical protein